MRSLKLLQLFIWISSLAVLAGCARRPPASLLGPDRRLIASWRVEMRMVEMGQGRQTEDFFVSVDSKRGELRLRDWGQHWSSGPEPRHYPGFRILCTVPLDMIDGLQRALGETDLPVESTVSCPLPPDTQHASIWELCVVRAGEQRCSTRHKEEWAAVEGVGRVVEELTTLRRHALRHGTRYPDD